LDDHVHCLASATAAMVAGVLVYIKSILKHADLNTELFCMTGKEKGPGIINTIV